MQWDVLIPAIAAATCFQYSLFFGMLWHKHRAPEQAPLGTFSLFAAALGIMLLGALAMQRVDGPHQAELGLLWYRIQFTGICITVAALLRFSSQISGQPLPASLDGRRLAWFTLVMLGLAWTPVVFHLPMPGTPRGDFDEADRGLGFLPYVALQFAGVCYAVRMLYRGMLASRRLPTESLATGSPYFRDIRLFLFGVLLFLPAGIYELTQSLGWAPDLGSLPLPRSLAAVVLCGLTARLLVHGIFEIDRRKQAAETRATAYLHAMSYATHQVRSNVDNILWQLRASLETLEQRATASSEREGIQGAMDEASGLRVTFNSLLFGARDAAGQDLKLSRPRCGDLAGFLEPLCRQRIAMACRSRGWNGLDDLPYTLCVKSELRRPILFSRDAMQHVFAVLIDNAMKYSAEGSPISVLIRPVGEQVEVRVRDQGIGITPGLEEAIFLPFGRGDAEERSPHLPGNGIGLHLARRLAESQGGTLSAESGGHGCGSTFVLMLPLHTEE